MQGRFKGRSNVYSKIAKVCKCVGGCANVIKCGMFRVLCSKKTAKEDRNNIVIFAIVLPLSCIQLNFKTHQVIQSWQREVNVSC